MCNLETVDFVDNSACHPCESGDLVYSISTFYSYEVRNKKLEILMVFNKNAPNQKLKHHILTARYFRFRGKDTENQQPHFERQIIDRLK